MSRRLSGCVCKCVHKCEWVHVDAHTPGSGWGLASTLSLAPVLPRAHVPYCLATDMTVTVRRAQCRNCISSRTQGHQRLAESPVCNGR